MTSIIYVLITCILAIVQADEQELYNTKLATSDLNWDQPSSSFDAGWEEVSSFGSGFNSTIRSYQICNVGKFDTNNWIRSPFILSRGGKQIHLEVEFSISRCDEHQETSSCKETFNIFYYEADSNIASSTFPPWQEKPYKKVDTVAANKVGKINTKTFNFGPVARKGFYIAVQDQGACMSLMSLRVYYYYCSETSVDFVAYPRTVSEPGIASLVTVEGECVPHAAKTGSEALRYRCSSNGQWQIPTGKCDCMLGYQSNFARTDCFACPAGFYKLVLGQGTCIPCPVNSGRKNSRPNVDVTVNQCPCHPGHARGPGESISLPCSRPPSKPIFLVVVKSNSSAAELRWKSPIDDGGRKNVSYKFKCEVSEILQFNVWKNCASRIHYMAPSRDGKFYKTYLHLAHLHPYRKYRFTVFSQNGAFSEINHLNANNRSSSVIFQTNQSAPSSVTKLRVTKHTSNEVSFVWGQPAQPNGVIIGYEIKLHPLLQNTPSSLFHDSRNEPYSTSNWTVHNFIHLNGLLENTVYKVLIRAKTAAGFGPYNNHFTFKTLRSSTASNDSNSSSLIIAIVALFLILVLALFFLIMFRYRKTGKLLCGNTAGRRSRRNRGQQSSSNGPSLQQESLLQETLIVDLPPPGQRLYVDYPDPHVAIVELGCEINPAMVKTEELIGTEINLFYQGEFAEVYQGKMKTGNGFYEKVAVKKLKEGASDKDQNNFLREASTMAQFKHENVIQLKGAVTRSCSHIMIVTEFMQNKSLDRFLQINQGKLTIVQLVQMLKGIASGMQYLSSIKYIHRDLAARNILVDSNLVCKVSDFGLSRSLENNPYATYTTQGGKIAIRWTALESILYRKFTSASDVWSYGILMWEVMSYGEKPYWDMSNDEVIKNIQSGMRLPAPKGCPEVLHELMLHCWQSEPQARPSFSEIAEKLDSLLGQPMLLLPDVAYQTTLPSNNLAQFQSTPTIGKTVVDENAGSVEKWLELQRLGEYSIQFKERGIDNLEKVCNLTINDLKSMGIDVTLHINKLENGIQTLKRHLSSSSSPQSNHSSTSSRNQVEDKSGFLISPGSIRV